MIRLQPTSEEESVSYNAFYEYLETRKRFGVVGSASSASAVKDCYIMSVKKEEKSPLPSCLLPLDGPGLDEERKHNVLLAIIVRAWRGKPRENQTYHIKLKESRRHSHDGGRSKRARTAEEDDAFPDDYDPAMAGGGGGGSNSASASASPEDDNEDYDPESAFEEEKKKQKKRKKSRFHDEPQFSDDDDDENAQPKRKKQEQQPFSDELAKLTQDIEKEKAEIANMSKAMQSSQDEKEPVKGFQGLPSTISSILFGGGSGASGSGGRGGRPRSDPRRQQQAGRQSPQSSVLSKMSDAELLAKVQVRKLYIRETIVSKNLRVTLTNLSFLGNGRTWWEQAWLRWTTAAATAAGLAKRTAGRSAVDAATADATVAAAAPALGRRVRMATGGRQWRRRRRRRRGAFQSRRIQNVVERSG